MKNFLKMIFLAGTAFFMLVSIVDLIGDEYSFPLPQYLAEKQVGPAPEPTEQELADMNYPQEEPGKDYTEGSIIGNNNRTILSLSRYAFMMEYQSEWRHQVEVLADKYILAFRALSTILFFGLLWMLGKTARRWWLESATPVMNAALAAKLPTGTFASDKTLPELLGDSLKQRQLKKQHEEFQQLESLLKSGLITQSQFDAKKALISAKIQKSIQ